MNDEALDSLLDWWRAECRGPCPFAFSAGFEFNSGIEKEDAEGWVTSCGYGAGLSDFYEVARLIGTSRSAVVFEVTEEVSKLRYRMSWLVDFDDGELHRVLETRSKIPWTPFS